MRERLPDKLGPTVATDPPWMTQARCLDADPDAFFPDCGEPVEPATRICGQCPVRRRCLEHALANGERFGVWGGLSPNQRRRIARHRRDSRR